MKKFWNWKSRMIRDQAGEEDCERVLFLNGMIAEESWFDDEVTPELFREELNAGSGNITVWINSPGGDCVAAAQIYNMLMDYKGDVTVKIDGLAASAASVIAMAGTKVLMSPVSMLMIHNPATIAFGDKNEMKKAIQMLSEVKESIMNAYEIKTGLDRNRISSLMDAETWMNANKAVELGFADGILEREDEVEDVEASEVSAMYSKVKVTNSLRERIAAKCKIDLIECGKKCDLTSSDKMSDFAKGNEKFDICGDRESDDSVPCGRSANDIRERLDFIKRFI